MKKKNQIFTVLLFLTTLYITAQPTIEWQKSFGGTGNDYAFSIQQNANGGYIVAGLSSSNDGDVTGNHGGSDSWVLKLDTSGVITWQKALGGTGNDNAGSIQQTVDGGYILAGYSESNDGDVAGNHGSSDFWVVKLDSNSVIIWQKCLGGSDVDIAKSIQQTTDGGYVVAGTSNSNDGDITGNHGGTDYWVVKLDSVGVIMWQKSLGGTSSDNANCIQQTADGGYIIAGTSYSNDGDVSGNHGNFDYWVVKLDSIGVIVWQVSLGTWDYDWGYSVQQTLDDGYIVAGKSTQIGDIMVVKLSSTGVTEWQKSVYGMYYDYANSIKQTVDGGYIVAGQTSVKIGSPSSSIFDYQGWVVKLDSTGDVDWKKNIGENMYSIQQTLDEGYVVAGYYNPTTYGPADILITKLNKVQIIGMEEITEQNLFSVFPNPATNQINIKANAKLVGAIYTIYDNMGKKVLSGKLNTEKTVIELGNLSGGLYLFSVGENMQQTFKVVKE